MGEYLQPYARPQAPILGCEDANIWSPFNSRLEFDFAYYHFVEIQNSARLIDEALSQWAAGVMQYGGSAPWKNSKELYASIDAIKHGDSPWKMYTVCYGGPLPPGTPPKWMTQTYELCTRDSRQVLHQQLATTDFKDKINLSPYRQFDRDHQRIRSNLMSADWAWKQAVRYIIQVKFPKTNDFTG
jgi:hypothetical protein